MRAFITVIIKKHKIKIWNKVRMNLQGDCSELINLQKELNEIKKEVNRDVNRNGLKLKDVEIRISLS